jgi:hypothetical protein
LELRRALVKGAKGTVPFPGDEALREAIEKFEAESKVLSDTTPGSDGK